MPGSGVCQRFDRAPPKTSDLADRRLLAWTAQDLADSWAWPERGHLPDTEVRDVRVVAYYSDRSALRHRGQSIERSREFRKPDTVASDALADGLGTFGKCGIDRALAAAIPQRFIGFEYRDDCRSL